jgi:hypothetical protein
MNTTNATESVNLINPRRTSRLSNKKRTVIILMLAVLIISTIDSDFSISTNIVAFFNDVFYFITSLF